MCTIALLQGPPGHLILAGNRDEQHARGPALPPQHTRVNGVLALMPIDTDAGGSWIGVNVHGLCATLLNLYQEDTTFEPQEPAISRGQLVHYLLGAQDPAHARELLNKYDEHLRAIRPFTLLIAQARPSLDAFIARWNGKDLTRQAVQKDTLLISSGVDLEGAIAARTDALSDLRWSEDDEDIISAFAQTGHEQNGYSVCMSRDDAATVSHTLIRLDLTHAHMTYLHGPPCQSPKRTAASLELAPY